MSARQYVQASAEGDTREALAERNFRSVADRVQHLVEAHSLPEEVHPMLAFGVLEVHVYLLDISRVLSEATTLFVPVPDIPL